MNFYLGETISAVFTAYDADGNLKDISDLTPTVTVFTPFLTPIDKTVTTVSDNSFSVSIDTSAMKPGKFNIKLSFEDADGNIKIGKIIPFILYDPNNAIVGEKRATTDSNVLEVPMTLNSGETAFNIYFGNDNNLVDGSDFLTEEITEDSEKAVTGGVLYDKFNDHLKAIALGLKGFNSDLTLSKIISTSDTIDSPSENYIYLPRELGTYSISRYQKFRYYFTEATAAGNITLTFDSDSYAIALTIGTAAEVAALVAATSFTDMAVQYTDGNDYVDFWKTTASDLTTNSFVDTDSTGVTATLSSLQLYASSLTIYSTELNLVIFKYDGYSYNKEKIFSEFELLNPDAHVTYSYVNTSGTISTSTNVLDCVNTYEGDFSYKKIIVAGFSGGESAVRATCFDSNNEILYATDAGGNNQFIDSFICPIDTVKIEVSFVSKYAISVYKSRVADKDRSSDKSIITTNTSNISNNLLALKSLIYSINKKLAFKGFIDTNSDAPSSFAKGDYYIPIEASTFDNYNSVVISTIVEEIIICTGTTSSDLVKIDVSDIKKTKLNVEEDNTFTIGQYGNDDIFGGIHRLDFSNLKVGDTIKASMILEANSNLTRLRIDLLDDSGTTSAGSFSEVNLIDEDTLLTHERVLSASDLETYTRYRVRVLAQSYSSNYSVVCNNIQTTIGRKKLFNTVTASGETEIDCLLNKNNDITLAADSDIILKNLKEGDEGYLTIHQSSDSSTYNYSLNSISADYVATKINGTLELQERQGDTILVRYRRDSEKLILDVFSQNDSNTIETINKVGDYAVETPNGTITRFHISEYVNSNTENIAVYVSGVRQILTTNYTFNSDFGFVEFVTAPGASDTVTFDYSYTKTTIKWNFGFEDVSLDSSLTKISGVDTGYKLNNDWGDFKGVRSNNGSFSIYYESDGEIDKAYSEIVANPDGDGNVLHFTANDVNVIEDEVYTKVRLQSQNFRSKGFKELTHKIKFYMPASMADLEDFTDEINYSGADSWFTLMEFFNDASGTTYPFRITVSLNKASGAGNSLYFGVETQKYTTYWVDVDVFSNTSFALPFGEWLTAELYIKEGDENTGKIKLTITDSSDTVYTICDATCYTYNPDADTDLDNLVSGITALQCMKMYTSDDLMNYMSGLSETLDIYWNDWEFKGVVID